MKKIFLISSTILMALSLGTASVSANASCKCNCSCEQRHCRMTRMSNKNRFHKGDFIIPVNNAQKTSKHIKRTQVRKSSRHYEVNQAIELMSDQLGISKKSMLNLEKSLKHDNYKQAKRLYLRIQKGYRMINHRSFNPKLYNL